MSSNNSNYSYSTAEVCEMFSISKSTLFRWEREGSISPANRDKTDQRLYTEENLREIGQRLENQLKTKFKRRIGTDDEKEIAKAHEELYVWKFIQNEPSALDELENYPILSADSIRKLCRINLERNEPSSITFYRVAKIIADKSKKLNEAKSGGEL